MATLRPSTKPASLRPWRNAPELRRVPVWRCRSEEPDHRHRRLLPSRALHLGRKQQSAATEQRNEFTPLAVQHRGLPPLCVAPLTGPCAQSSAGSSLPQGGPQVLGANLKCSESRALGGLPLNVPPIRGRIAHGGGVGGRAAQKPHEIMSGQRGAFSAMRAGVRSCRMPNIAPVSTSPRARSTGSRAGTFRV